MLKIGNTFQGIPTSNLFQGTIYFVRQVTSASRHLACLNLVSLEMQDVFEFGDCPAPTICSISPDGKTFVAGIPVRDDIYGLYRIDLPTGEWEVFHEHKDILNPHVQIEPSEGEDILVQWNRGGRKDEHGNIINLVGEEGASLYVIDKNGGNIRYLPVGKPHTAGVTGHECWIGNTKSILLTTGDPAPAGRLFTVSPGDEKAKLICRGFGFNHISASVDGRFFAGDWGTRVYIGSFKTGHVRYLCDTRGRVGGPQYSHPHPYMTPGNKYVIFNSNETGVAQVYSAEIPDGFLDSLESVME
ncbi:MAG: hypothetical protein QF473_03740 [Planctomycetota bacterium]|nr:hypothetical protein [Planctomycetota bacterium]